MFVTCYDQERRRRALMQKRGNSKHVSSLSTTCMVLPDGYTHNMPLVMRETCCSTSGVEHVVCIKKLAAAALSREAQWAKQTRPNKFHFWWDGRRAGKWNRGRAASRCRVSTQYACVFSRATHAPSINPAWQSLARAASQACGPTASLRPGHACDPWQHALRHIMA